MKTICNVVARVFKTKSSDNASSDWLSHHGILAIIPCSPNYGNCTRLLKIKNKLKSVVFTNKAGKNSRYFVGVFDKTIIPLALVGHHMIITNSALRASLPRNHLISNAHSWNNC